MLSVLIQHRSEDVAVLLGLPVNGRIITSTGTCNQIVLYERLFGLTPSPSELKGVVYVLNGLR